MYDLSAVLDVDALEAVKPGTSILISGPAMTGKQGLVYDILADGVAAGEGTVILSTGDRAGTIVEEFGQHAAADSYPLAVIDTAGDATGNDPTDSDVFVYHASSPGDLTGMGIGITEALETLHGRGVERGRLSLSSLSTMLTYTDRKTVFKLCHVLSSRLDAAEYLGLFTIDASAHDEQTLQVIKQAFDGMIEIRERDGVREVRVRGLTTEPSAWIEL
ncbi:MAG: hypothetical protein ABEI98_05435 [Halorhabdus sp.]